MTYRQMIRLLKKWGIDVDNFDHIGRKTLRHLHNEIQKQECYLRWDPIRERVVRSSFSVKIYIRTVDGIYLLEVRREFGNGDPINTIQEYSLKETLLLGEKPLNCAVRCLAEELNYFLLTPEQLKPLPLLVEGSWHESSVYPNILTHNYSCHFELIVPKVFDREGPIVKDSGTTIYLEWKEPM